MRGQKCSPAVTIALLAIICIYVEAKIYKSIYRSTIPISNNCMQSTYTEAVFGTEYIGACTPG